MTDEEAVILMVDSNIQRENLLPSEKAFAYRMKFDALKHQGQRTSGQVVPKSDGNRTMGQIGDTAGESYKTVQRYIRLTNLVKPVLDLVDEGCIAFSPAVELSFLSKQEQTDLLDVMKSEDCTPSLSQAVRLKKLSQSGGLTPEKLLEIMSEEKANQKERVRIEISRIRQYFPKGYTVRQMEDEILKMLEAYGGSNW